MKKVLCVVLMCFLLSGCTAPKQYRQTLFAMDTVMDLQVWAVDEKVAQEGLNAVAELIQLLEKTWSATDADSLLSALNRGQGSPDGDQQALLDRLCGLSAETGGAFDPRLHSVIEAWGFLSGEYRVPSEAELEAALSQETWNLGAAIKGYAGQQAAALLETMDVDRGILNLGGNIQTYGQKPDGTSWKIGIQNPSGSGNAGIISVEGTMAVVTSGDYQRCFTRNGKVYHHILDPKTGYPAQSGLKSVTVICQDGLKADVLSTALYVMGLEGAAAFWQASSDFEAVFILSDGTIQATEGVALSGCEFEVICREK